MKTVIVMAASGLLRSAEATKLVGLRALVCRDRFGRYRNVENGGSPHRGRPRTVSNLKRSSGKGCPNRPDWITLFSKYCVLDDQITIPLGGPRDGGRDHEQATLRDRAGVVQAGPAAAPRLP